MTTTKGLSLTGITKRYGDLVALDDVSFAVHPGELFGFVGSNGAGKTTTMRIVLGVLAADAGQVLLDGRPVDLDVRRRIGYMPAERGLYPKMKVGQQLAYFARLHGMSSGDTADAIARWTTRLGIADRTDDSVDTLSTGNQQRVQLAAALVHDPDVLVLDEPFSGLDPMAVDVMGEVLVEKSAAGVPVIFSSHQLELVERLCDRVGIIARGRLVAVGTVGELSAGQPIHLDVGSDDTPPGWAAGIRGVRTLYEGAGTTRLELGTDADDQDVLSAALRHGPVHGFTRHKPRLSELFREVVSS